MIHSVSSAGTECVAIRHEIHLVPGQMRQIEHAAGVSHKIDPGVGKKLHQQVDVAIRTQLLPRGRPEVRELPDAIPPAEISRFVGIDLRINELMGAAYNGFRLCLTAFRPRRC